MNYLITICELLLILCISTLSAFASEETVLIATDSSTKAIVSDTKLKIKACDSALEKLSPRMKLFARVSDPVKSKEEGYYVPSDKIVLVSDKNSWPDDTVNSYAVLFDKDGFVIAFDDIPTSESGDWFNRYTHYFNKEGETIAFKRYSGFFMGCPSEGSNETSVYYYNGKHNLIQKEYTLVDGGGKEVDPKECDFMFRHEYKIYKNWKDLAQDIGILKVLNKIK